MHLSTKKFGPISTGHRNWVAAFNASRDSVKCSKIHGYSRYVQLTFQGELDDKGWVMDFGDCKYIKQWLEDQWDHKVLVSDNDPELANLKLVEEMKLLDLTIVPTANNWGPGIEGSATWLGDVMNEWVKTKTNGRVTIAKVEIWEHEFNSAVYIPENK